MSSALIERNYEESLHRRPVTMAAVLGPALSVLLLEVPSNIIRTSARRQQSMHHGIKDPVISQVFAYQTSTQRKLVSAERRAASVAIRGMY